MKRVLAENVRRYVRAVMVPTDAIVEALRGEGAVSPPLQQQFGLKITPRSESAAATFGASVLVTNRSE